MSSVEELGAIVRSAVQDAAPLDIQAGGSKRFLGRPPVAGSLVLDVGSYAGVISYHPAELVVRAKAGTRLTEIVSLLDAEGQMLAFDPPVHDESSTVGGLVATGLSGSRRPYAGAIKDAVLGAGLILQDGSYAEFGGQVMKNVAGYDVSRLVCGAFGILGPVADVSLKVLPRPEAETSIALEIAQDEARTLTRNLVRRVSGLSASCYMDGVLRLRFSGSATLVQQETATLGGEVIAHDFWAQLDSQKLSAFEQANDVWRLSASPEEQLDETGFQVMDWGFGQRWLFDPERDPRLDYKGAGHWTRFRHAGGGFDADCFQPLTALEMKITKRLKAAFDTAGVFNPGRLYEGL